MTTRPATEADLQALIALRIQPLEAEEPGLEAALSAWFRHHLADGSFPAWVADDGGRMVVASGLTVIDRPPYPGNLCYAGAPVIVFADSSAACRRGHGRAPPLLSKLLSNFAPSADSKIALFVAWSSDPLTA